MVHFVLYIGLEYPDETVEVAFKGTPVVPKWSELDAQKIASNCGKALLLSFLGIIMDIFEVCTGYILLLRAAALCLGLKEASLSIGQLGRIPLVADHTYLSSTLLPSHAYVLFDLVLAYIWLASLRWVLSMDPPISDCIDIRTSIPSGTRKYLLEQV